MRVTLAGLLRRHRLVCADVAPAAHGCLPRAPDRERGRVPERLRVAPGAARGRAPDHHRRALLPVHRPRPRQPHARCRRSCPRSATRTASSGSRCARASRTASRAPCVGDGPRGGDGAAVGRGDMVRTPPPWLRHGRAPRPLVRAYAPPPGADPEGRLRGLGVRLVSWAPWRRRTSGPSSVRRLVAQKSPLPGAPGRAARGARRRPRVLGGDIRRHAAAMRAALRTDAFFVPARPGGEPQAAGPEGRYHVARRSRSGGAVARRGEALAQRLVQGYGAASGACGPTSSPPGSCGRAAWSWGCPCRRMRATTKLLALARSTTRRLIAGRYWVGWRCQSIMANVRCQKAPLTYGFPGRPVRPVGRVHRDAVVATP